MHGMVGIASNLAISCKCIMFTSDLAAVESNLANLGSTKVVSIAVTRDTVASATHCNLKCELRGPGTALTAE
eukprot:6237083-Amphidinium_carterae.1